MILDGRMKQSLDPEVCMTATTFVVRDTATDFSVLAGMVEGCSRVKVMQVRIKYNSLRYSWRLIRLAVHLFS